jgi:hypothetical protein
MQKLAPARYVEVTDYEKIQIHQTLNMARLMVLVAQEQEQASVKMEQLTTRLIAQTDTLIKFTKGLYWLTAAFLALGVAQVFVAFAYNR